MKELQTVLNDISRAWLERRFDRLARFFDENIVMKGPAFKEFALGRDKVVQSYADFMGKSKVTDYSESNHSFERWGETAAATYDWKMTYEQDGKTSTESGQDMFIFARRDAEWVAVMRVILF